MADNKGTNNLFKYLITMVVISLMLNFLAVGMVANQDTSSGSVCVGGITTNIEEIEATYGSFDPNNETHLYALLMDSTNKLELTNQSTNLGNTLGIEDNSTELTLVTSGSGNEDTGFFSSIIDKFDYTKDIISSLAGTAKLIYPKALLNLANCEDLGVLRVFIQLWISLEILLIVYLILKLVTGRLNISN